MFRSQVELEFLANDRVAEMAARQDHDDQVRQATTSMPGSGQSPKLGSRVRHGVGRGLISLGEHLAERPAAPPPVASSQLTIARSR